MIWARKSWGSKGAMTPSTCLFHWSQHNIFSPAWHAWRRSFQDVFAITHLISFCSNLESEVTKEECFVQNAYTVFIPLSKTCLISKRWNSSYLEASAFGHYIFNIQEYLIPLGSRCAPFLLTSLLPQETISTNLVSAHFWRFPPLPLYW